MSDFDVVVIGGGPGGYVAAIRAAQLGLKTACVEMRGSLGGTCLNVGCIPSKALLHSSHLYEMAGHAFADHGIKTKPELDLKAMLGRKDKVVGDLTQGIEFLFKKNKVAYYKGKGVMKDANTVAVEGGDNGGQTLKAKNVIVATGSEVTPLSGVEIDETRIVSSTGALNLAEVPKKMIVIGAGIIGLELGSVWRRLGAEVTVVEYLDRVCPGMDAELAKTLQRTLKKQGLGFRMGQKVTGAETGKNGVSLSIEPAKGGDTEALDADVVLVAIGRRPVTTGLGLAAADVETDDKGFIPVNDHWQTKAANVYAIGDVIGGKMLAHKAEDEGMAVAEFIAGQKPHINYDAIPAIIYTHPEGATVGKTEEELKEAGIAYKVGKFPFTANSRARCIGGSDGFVKLLADARTDTVLGCHILGPEAGDLIMEVVLGMEFKAAAEDIARTCHGHPALGEAVREAALGVDGRMIHA